MQPRRDTRRTAKDPTAMPLDPRTPFHQGYYTPQNPHKYIGKVGAIRYMSSWELEMHRFLDMNEEVVEWCSEPFAIPYIKPTDGKVHRYFPDYYVKYRNKYTGVEMEEIIEVKPLAQTRRKKNASLFEAITYQINIAKWRYAIAWCEKRGYKFRLMTERASGVKNENVFKNRKPTRTRRGTRR